MFRAEEKIAVIGLGRLGSALLKALYKNHYLIHALIDQNLSLTRKIGAIVNAEISSNNIFELDKVDIIFISVPDDEVVTVVSDLKIHLEQRNFSKFIYHTSGVLTSDVLNPLKEFHIACASFHPIQTFSGNDDDWKKFQNCYFGTEGDSVAIEKASQIINDLKGHQIIVPKELKPVYHLACIMASNYMVSLMVPVIEIFKKMKYSEQEALKMLFPILSTTLTNLRNHGIEKSLSGPILRGDIGTIEKHLEILSTEFPFYKSIYQQLAQIVLELKSVREKLSSEKYEAIMQLVNERRTQS